MMMHCFASLLVSVWFAMVLILCLFILILQEGVRKGASDFFLNETIPCYFQLSILCFTFDLLFLLTKQKSILWVIKTTRKYSKKEKFFSDSAKKQTTKNLV